MVECTPIPTGRNAALPAWALRALLALLVCTLAFLAAGCGGGRVKDTHVDGLGENLSEIQRKARKEGELDLVVRAGYGEQPWATTFTRQTGCEVAVVEGSTSDEVVDLMSKRRHDAVLAAGDTAGRLIEKGTVAPIDFELVPSYADVVEGLKGLASTTVDGLGYGVPQGRAWTSVVWRANALPPDTDTSEPIWPGASAFGRLSMLDDPMAIADAAIYLRSARPKLAIRSPFELDDTQFRAALNLLRRQRANVGEYWTSATSADQVASFSSGDSVIGTTWPRQFELMMAENPPVPVQAIKPREGTTGWSDSWMISAKAEHPNCAYLWMDYMISPEANARASELFGEAPSNARACEFTEDPGLCATFHADDEPWWEDVSLWTTPQADCGDARGDVCKTYDDWRRAWDQLRGRSRGEKR